MTTTPKLLIPSKFAETSETSQYQSDSCKTSIDKFTATNRGASNAILTVHLVASGGSAGEPNAISKVIAPGSTWTGLEVVGHLMESGDTISTIASAATISIRASGRQFT